jgi:ABC-type multidrug transport system permease subunit
MKRALQITLNEVRLYLIDKGDMAFSILLPVLTFALMFGAFGGDTQFKATANIVNEDYGTYSQQIIKQFDAVDGVSVDIITAERANTLLDRSDILVAFYIPAGFSDTLASGGKTQITVKQRGNGGTEGQILASILGGIAEGVNQQFQVNHAVAANLQGMGVSGDRISVVTQEILAQQRLNPSVGVKETTVGGSTDFVNQFLPGIITMYVLFSLSLVAPTLVEERKRGTLERLLTTRLSVGELFFGKFTSIIARGFLQTFILLALSYAVFQMFTPLSFLYCLVITLIFSAAAAGIGIIIASLARTQDSANWIAVVVTMFMAMMGGTFFAVDANSVLATIGKFSLNTYANDALKTVISQGGSLADAWQPLIIMAAVAAAGLIISRLLFKAVQGAGK